MPYGLLEKDMLHILEAVRCFPEIAQVVLFGSRAKGNYKTGSDVDLAIKGASVTYDTAVKLAEMLNEEKPLPYFFDVIHYETVTDPQFVQHIDRVGIVLYSRQLDPKQADGISCGSKAYELMKMQEETV